MQELQLDVSCQVVSTAKEEINHHQNSIMANLPKDRLEYDKPPFSRVGVDCFGPFLVKQGRSVVKRYGCLFTCLVMRAAHIEVVHSLDTHSFIDALHRFINRRGKPEL